MLTWLLQQGGDANSSDGEGRTALHYAAACSTSQHSAQCLKVLIEHGAKVNVEYSNKKITPLMCAAGSGRVDLVDILLEANAQVKNHKPLLWAVRSENPTCVLHVVLAGAPVDGPNGNYCRPVHLAAKLGYDNCLKVLIDKGADLNRLDERLQNPIHCAAFDNGIECLKLIIETIKTYEIEKKEKIINAVDSEEKTPLHVAVLNQSSQAVIFLISAGCDINARDKYGFTPLYRAALCKNSEIASLLIEKNADLMAESNNGATALEMVARHVPCAIRRRLDSGVSVPNSKLTDIDCEWTLALDFRVLMLPSSNEGSSNERVGELGLLESLVEIEQRHLIQHPIIDAFLHLKWSKTKWLLYLSLIFHFVFVALLSSSVFLTYVTDRPGNSTGLNVNSTSKKDTTGFIIAVWIFGLMLFSKEMFQLCRNFKRYWRDIDNYFQIALLAGTVAVTIPFDGSYHECQRLSAAVVVIVGWLHLMMHLGRIPSVFHSVVYRSFHLNNFCFDIPFFFTLFIFVFFSRRLQSVRAHVHEGDHKYFQTLFALLNVVHRILNGFRRPVSRREIHDLHNGSGDDICHDDRRTRLQGYLLPE